MLGNILVDKEKVSIIYLFYIGSSRENKQNVSEDIVDIPIEQASKYEKTKKRLNEVDGIWENRSERPDFMVTHFEWGREKLAQSFLSGYRVYFAASCNLKRTIENTKQQILFNDLIF